MNRGIAPCVALFPPRESDLARVALELRGVAELCGVRDATSFELAVQLGRLRAAIVRVDGTGDVTRLVTAIGTARALAARLPTLLWLDRDERAFTKVPALLATGARADVVVRDHDPLAEAVRRVLDAGWEPGPAAELLPRLLDAAPPAQHPFVIAFLIRPAWTLRIGTVFDWMGEYPRTIRDRFESAGLVNPSTLRGYCLALSATWLLDRRGLSPTEVAARLQCPDLTSLNRLLRTYALGPAGEQQHAGSAERLLHHVESVLRRRAMPRGGGSQLRRRAATRRIDDVDEPGGGRNRYTAPAIAAVPLVPTDQSAALLARLSHSPADPMLEIARRGGRYRHALVLSSDERDRLVAAGVRRRGLAERLRYRPMIGGWAIVPLAEGDAVALLQSACRASDVDDALKRRRMHHLAVRLRRLADGRVPPDATAAPSELESPSAGVAAPPFHTVTLALPRAERDRIAEWTGVPDEWPEPLRRALAGDGPLSLPLTYVLELIDRLKDARVPRPERGELRALIEGIRRALREQWPVPVRLGHGQRYPVSFTVRELAIVATVPRPRRLTAWLASPESDRPAHLLLDHCESQLLVEALADSQPAYGNAPAERSDRDRLIRRIQAIRDAYEDELW